MWRHMCLLQEFSALHAHSLQTEVDITCVGCISRFATSVGTLNENVNENTEGSKTWEGA